MDASASEFLAARGFSENTVNIVLHRLWSSGYAADRGSATLEELKTLAEHLEALNDKTAKRNALEALLPPSDVRPLQVPRLNKALAGAQGAGPGRGR